MSSRHLSSEQIAAWIAGDRPEPLSGHLRECAECKAQIAGFEAVAGAFRNQVRQTAARHTIPDFQPRSALSLGTRWALAGALAALLIAVPIYQRHQKALRPAPVLVADISDAALLQQVDAQLSRGVPGSMEPLTALVWSPQELQSAAAQLNSPATERR